MKARRTTLKALAAAITLGFAFSAPVANAQDKGTVGVNALCLPTQIPHHTDLIDNLLMLISRNAIH